VSAAVGYVWGAIAKPIIGRSPISGDKLSAVLLYRVAALDQRQQHRDIGAHFRHYLGGVFHLVVGGGIHPANYRQRYCLARSSSRLLLNWHRVSPLGFTPALT